MTPFNIQSADVPLRNCSLTWGIIGPLKYSNDKHMGAYAVVSPIRTCLNVIDLRAI